MKKKLLAVNFAVATALCVAVGLSACDKGGLKGVSSKNLVSDVVTEEEWNAAFEDGFLGDNYRIDMTIELIQTFSGDNLAEFFDFEEYEGVTSITATCVLVWSLIHDNGKEFLVYQYEFNDSVTGKEQGRVEYYRDANEDIWYYRDGDGAWDTAVGFDMTPDWESFDPFYPYDVIEDDIRDDISVHGNSISYNQFSYDDAAKGYRALWKFLGDGFGDDRIVFTSCVVKLRNQKLCSVLLEYSSEEEYEGCKISDKSMRDYVVSYGGQSVTLPEVNK